MGTKAGQETAQAFHALGAPPLEAALGQGAVSPQQRRLLELRERLELALGLIPSNQKTTREFSGSGGSDPPPPLR